METKAKVKYLGDQLDESGTIKATIEDRKAKAFGIVADITAITDSIPLGAWRIQAALLLRQAMLVNGTLFNSECWQGKNSSKLISDLSKPDQLLFRSIVDGHSKVPIEFMHLEMGTVPFQFIHKGRRANFLQYILKKHSDELIKKVYTAQKVDSMPGDFCNLVMDDLRDLNIHMEEKQIALMNTERFKKLIKSKVKEASFKYLTDLQQTHSKIKNIKYDDLTIQPYLSSSLFSKSEVSTLFRLRSRTIPGIKNDFRQLYNNDLPCSTH